MPKQNQTSKYSPARPAASLPEVGFVRLPTILSLIPISAAGWWNGIRHGKFPKGVSLGPRTTAWKVSDIRSLIDRIGAGE